MMEKAAILLVFTATVNGDNWRGHDCQENCTGNILDGLFVDMRQIDNDKVQFEVVTLDNTWFGIILGTHRMVSYPEDNTDIIQFSANGSESYCSDFWTIVNN